jgi:hypothetical protein
VPPIAFFLSGKPRKSFRKQIAVHQPSYQRKVALPSTARS